MVNFVLGGKMVRNLSIYLFMLILGVAQSINVSAQLVNPGFETGNTEGWSLLIPPGGSVNVVDSFNAYPDGNLYSPQEGAYFVLLKTDGPGSFTEVSQTITLNEGDTLYGWAAFDARDYFPFNDSANVEIRDTSGTILSVPFFADVQMVGNYGETPWTLWSWTASVTGTYKLVYRVANTGDNAFDSYALFDVLLIEVEIDIKPGSDPNSINLSSNGVIPVAIFSTESFSAPVQIDVDTLDLSGSAVKLVGKYKKSLCHDEDANEDGLVDLVCQFETNQLDLEADSIVAVLTGNTFSGIPIYSEDFVNIVP
jgi:hypothetical protein